MKGGIGVNYDKGLEMEADKMSGAIVLHQPVLSQQTKPFPGRDLSNLVDSPLQLKVGFEFEDGKWAAWQQGYFSRIYPAARKAVLHTGKGFNLEADDTPGPRSSNLEFVTKAFDETQEGLDELEETLTAIKNLITNNLDPYVGAKGVKDEADKPPPYTFDKDNFVSKDKHKLNGPAYGDGKWLHLSGGKKNGAFKMQATAGASLSDLPMIMKYFGSTPNETDEEKKERKPARALLSGPEMDPAKNSIQKVIGGSPDIAKTAFIEFKKTFQSVPWKTEHESEAIGFFAAVIMTMKMLQLPNNGVIKYRVPLMFRTNFSKLFGILPGDIQTALTANNNILVAKIIEASNAQPLLPRSQGADPDTALTKDSALIRPPVRPGHAPHTPVPHEALSGVTIGMWIKGFTAGKDYLTPDVINDWLKGEGYWWWSRKDKVALIESFDSIPNVDESASKKNKRKLGVFENRGIVPKGAFINLTIDEAAAIAWNQLLFYKKIEDMHSLQKGVGEYPNKPVGGQ